MGDADRTYAALARRTLTIAVVVVLIVLGLLLLGFALHVFFLLFAGALLAVFLRGLADWLSKCTGLAEGWSLAVVLLALVGVIALAGWLIAPGLAAQADEFTNTIPRSAEQARLYLGRYEWGRRLLEESPGAGPLFSGQGNAWARATGLVSTSLGVLTDAIVLLFFGLFLAVSPSRYREGFLRLLPAGRRQRGQEVLRAMGHKLRWWLVGQSISMIEVGLLTGLGLWLLGVPLALTLGILTGLLNFVPVFGPLVAAVPTVLIALTVGPMEALYALLLYTAVACFDGYVVAPLVQQRTSALPPALLIGWQALVAILTGQLGLALAAPLLVVAVVCVQKVYVEDVLGGPAGDGRNAATSQ